MNKSAVVSTIVLALVFRSMMMPSRGAVITESGDAEHCCGLVAVPLRVALVQLAAVRAEREFLQRVLIDRGEHPVAHPTAGIAAAQQTLVEQLLHRVHVGADDRLCGLVRAAVAEDSQSGEELPLVIREQFV